MGRLAFYTLLACTIAATAACSKESGGNPPVGDPDTTDTADNRDTESPDVPPDGDETADLPDTTDVDDTADVDDAPDAPDGDDTAEGADGEDGDDGDEAVAPACSPNPCTEANRTVCVPLENGTAFCDCDTGWKFNALGTACTQDPCDPNPCTTRERGTCVAGTGGTHRCDCSPGYRLGADGTTCTDNPCDPNPCTTPGKTVCRNAGGAAACACNDGYRPGSDPTVCTNDPCDPNPCTTVPGKTVCTGPAGGTATCACDSRYYDTAPDGTCPPKAGAPPTQIGGVNFSGSSPVYTADVQVVDAATNAPLAGADVWLGTNRNRANAQGMVTLTGLDGNIVTRVRVEAQGRAGANAELTIARGLSALPLRVPLQALRATGTISPDRGGTVAVGPVEIRAPRNAFSYDDGELYPGDVQIITTPVTGADEAGGVLARNRRIANADGTIGFLSNAVGEILLSWRAPDAAPGDPPLVLSDDASISFTVEVAVPAPGDVIPEGAEVPFYCFDDDADAWRTEGTCRVVTLPPLNTGGPARVGCTGSVRRPCRLTAGYTPPPIPGPTAFPSTHGVSNGCVAATFSPDLPARFKLKAVQTAVSWVERVTSNCGECNCPTVERPAAYGYDAGPPGTLFRPRWRMNGDIVSHSVFASDDTYVGKPSDGAHALSELKVRYVFTDLRTGRDTDLYFEVNVLALDPVAPAVAQVAQTDKFYRWFSLLGEFAFEFRNTAAVANPPETFDPEQACATYNVPPPTEEQLLAAAYADKDGDKFPALPEGYAPSDADRKNWDCNDADAAVNPNAAEIANNNVDENCDGVALMQKNPRDYPNNPEAWNALCYTHCGSAAPLTCPANGPILPDAQDTPGDAFDQDCNGFVTDRDGDGYAVKGDNSPFAGRITGDDCDDKNPDANPGAQEQPGNIYDENCDGVALDRDNDGFYHPDHYPQGGTDGSKYGDCNDADDKVKPQTYAQGGNESFLAGYFTEQYPGGPMDRSYNYCWLFNSRRLPNATFRALAVDKNCDGWVTDMDGDGWTVPGDKTLGAERAWDMNDYDPRVYPGAPSTIDWLPPPMEQMSGGNAPGCEASPVTPDFVNDGSACPNMPDGSRTFCDHLNDADGDWWLVNVCNPRQWRDGDNPLRPLAVTAGDRTWGPCQFGGTNTNLPSCGPGLQCAYKNQGVRFSQAYLDVLRTQFNIDLSSAEFFGMCLPSCGGKCGPINPCDDEDNRHTCAITDKTATTPRQQVCNCSPGYTDVGGVCTKNCGSGAECDDGNFCTLDECFNNRCRHTNNTVPCDDGAYCNGTDTCRGGLCAQHTGSPCAQGRACGQTCSEALDSCTDKPLTAPAPVTEACRVALCNGPLSSGAAPADDGATCNVRGVCRGGACVCPDPLVGTPPDCRPADACTGNPCGQGNTCTVDSAAPRGYRCTCAAGYAGADCRSCAPGYESNQPGVCTICEAGSYSHSGGGCIPCSPGRFSAAGSALCTECPAGTAALSEGSIVCAPCAAGTIASVPGSARCEACPPGTAPFEEGTRCVQCAVNQVVLDGVCTQCPAGKVPVNGVCTACTAGSFAPAGSARCSFCPPGTYSQGGVEACSNCPDDKVQPSAGQSSCTACPPGMVAVARTYCVRQSSISD